MRSMARPTMRKQARLLFTHPPQSPRGEGPYFLGAEPLTIPMVRTGRGSTVKERGHSLFIW
jgi:hypothetical protein